MPTHCDHHYHFALSTDGVSYICISCGEDVTDLAYKRLMKSKICPICQDEFLTFHGKNKYCPFCKIRYPRHYQKQKTLFNRFGHKMKPRIAI